MAYQVNRRDGNLVANVADGTIDTSSTSITILGKGFNNYGEIVAENLHHMMEHFASSTAPTNAARGQLWFDTSGGAGNGVLRVNVDDTGSPDWVSVGSAIIAASTPSSGIGVGTFWFDTANQTLNVSTNGTTFTTLKTTIVSSTPPSGATEGDLWYDTDTKELKVYNSDLHGLGSDDWDVVGPARFVSSIPPNAAGDPEGSVKEGDEWWDSVNKQLYVYDSTNDQFRLIGPTAPAGTTETSVTGIEVDGNSLIAVTIDDDIVGIWSDRDFTPASAIVGYDDLAGGPTALKRGLNLAPNTGPSAETTMMNGTATAAQYADLAERYAVDYPVEPGDLMSMGGEMEVTKTTIEHDINVFGVVSENPAYLMNANAGPDKTHPAIAMTGRVYCKVVGPVAKGSRLVASGRPGVAKAIDSADIITHYPAIIGKSLVSSSDAGERKIEIVVGVK